MELVKIEELLEKYFEATTTLQEEGELREYFSSDDVASHLLSYKSMFGCFTSDLEKKISSKLLVKSMGREKRSGRFRFVAVAASLALVVSLFSSKYIVEKRQAGQAYEDTQRALSMISTELNKGNVAMSQLYKYEEVKNTIFKK
ncbi:MAG: hypothetical protein HRT66_03215 [Flavobacteriaceae bacterium]|nr:hypothetical protein [Flavobacteriaceae bacterium]